MTCPASLDHPSLRTPVEEVELFLLNVNVPRHFSGGTWVNRQHAFLRLASGGHSGWGEVVCAWNDPGFDLANRARPLTELRGQPVTEAFAYLRAGRGNEAAWPVRKLEMAEMALLDLAGRLLERPALDLLGLPGRASVPGLFCILENDPERVRERACLALDKNVRSHVKVKIFGDTALDTAVVAAAREVLGPNTFLVADANLGYPHLPGADLGGLAARLLELHRAGLDACEDPARLTNAEWVALQARVGDLALLPDFPVRPAWDAVHTLLPGMGRIYNLHPDSLGGVLDVPPLARRIESFGARVMIGDGSLVGPACTAWQQVAVGLGAAWVEALEKPEESDVFLRCITRQATRQGEDGRYGLAALAPGFGLEVDLDALRGACAGHRAFV